ncbi:hypothetical protein [uncultured Winogradskyella sp.]|uniref:hypothetical protein n=1 Tax=uncultured Winogradskyella sp. TaxID=395353 RepID=UPI002639E680|nr:hypothetical protein [uncultured Winogradskyella sp.]
METAQNTHFIDKIVDALKKAAVELEEFQVKAALGKAEAQDKYEELKKKFNLFIHESKTKVNTGKERVDDIHSKFDELRVQLALGKAETLEKFEAQKKQLLLTLHELEVKIKTNEKFKRMYAMVLIEIEKFKVSLDILEEKFKQGKTDVKVSFEKGKEEFKRFVDDFKEKYSKKEETKWEHFQNEISEAFTHFKRAFVTKA